MPRVYDSGLAAQAIDAILASRVTDLGGGQWSLDLPPNLDRKVYDTFKKWLESAGGKWVRSKGTHVLPVNAHALLAEFGQTRTLPNRKKDLQAFYSPPDVARRVALAADLRPGLRVLEPSAGAGALCDAALRVERSLEVHAFEIDEVPLEALRSVLGMARLGGKLYRDDFLSVDSPSEERDQFDRVLMNPPFAKGQECKHVLHALRFLRPGGVLVAVMSAAVHYRRDGQYALLARALWESRSHEIEDLPEGSFKESGTNVNTVLVHIEP